tara:strand:+ start:448 stop:813 length:366 start_codon:yes stop_codon:yes gene_type:complete
MAKVSTDIIIDYNDLTYTTSNDGTGTFDVTTTPAITPHNGKTNAFMVAGAFDGATVKLQYKIRQEASGNPTTPAVVDLGPETTLTSDGGGLFTTPVSDLQVKVTDAGTSFNVTVVIKPINL